MKITYNGALGPKITAGGIPFTAGEPAEVTEEALAASLLTKPYFGKSGARDQGPVTASPWPASPLPTAPAPMPAWR